MSSTDPHQSTTHSIDPSDVNTHSILIQEANNASNYITIIDDAPEKATTEFSCQVESSNLAEDPGEKLCERLAEVQPEPSFKSKSTIVGEECVEAQDERNNEDYQQAGCSNSEAYKPEDGSSQLEKGPLSDFSGENPLRLDSNVEENDGNSFVPKDYSATDIITKEAIGKIICENLPLQFDRISRRMVPLEIRIVSTELGDRVGLSFASGGPNNDKQELDLDSGRDTKELRTELQFNANAERRFNTKTSIAVADNRPRSLSVSALPEQFSARAWVSANSTQGLLESSESSLPSSLSSSNLSLYSSQYFRRKYTSGSNQYRTSKTSSRRTFQAPLRRLSELQSLKASLGFHLHESLLNLAYGKTKKQSDQMVSVSFKSLESFVTEDNLSGLQSFLSSRSVVIDDRDENATTALIFSASKGKADFCRELLDHGADVNAEDNDQWTSLITAAKGGYEETVQTLLEQGAGIEHRDIGGWTALMWACYKGNVGVAKILLAYGADTNAQGQHHMTSLVWAAGRGHLELVGDLLNKGAKVNIGDKFGTTPLIWACRKGYFEIVEKLLRHGANVDATGMYSWTPLLVATKGNFLELVHILLEQKPNVNALDKDGGTALTIACKEGFSEIASALLRSGAYVNIQDRNGDTNLIYASRGGHRSVMESLLKRHADTDMVGKDKKTALYWAVEKGHTQVVKMLLSSNADLEHTTKEGDTALLRAVRTKNAEIVQLLIDRKARVTGADKKGDTALHIAMRGRSKRIVEILLRNPKNSQMLYRPNRAGETPYNIDLSNQKTILGQIFGARRLNTNEENENMLGYDLYSSSLADILSEPSLSMPISVGLYARWGSGKSFLVGKLKEEMNSFARQWVEPLFQFTPLVFFLCVIISTIVGFITLLSSGIWYVGAATGSSIFLLIVLILLSIWYWSRSKYDWHLCYRWSVSLASQMASFRLVMQVIFCSPPGEQWKEWKGGVHEAKPLRFIFAEGAKPSSTGAGGNSAVQILGSLFDMLENQYGIFSTRFYRAFRPKPQGQTSPWRYRRLCGVPYIAIFFITLLCALALTYLAVTYGFHGYGAPPIANVSTSTVVPPLVKLVENQRSREHERANNLTKRSVHENVREKEDDDDDDDEEESDDDEEEDRIPMWHGRGFVVEEEDEEEDDDVYGRPLHGKLINPLLFILSALVALVVVANIHTLARMVRALIFSHKRHLLSSISKFETVNPEGYLPTLKSETSLMIDMVRCLDAFTCQQTRLVVILDGLDTCEQEKVLSVLDAVHSLFIDSSGPFIILLAIDPHIITRAIELNASKFFRESSISGHDYLRNIIHLPFYLQNAGLRKVKQAEQAAENIRGRSHGVWSEQETEVVSLATTSAMGGLHHMPVNRHMSSASELGYNMPPNRRLSAESGRSVARRNTSKGSRRLKQSDSIGSSIASNLHRVSAASDLNKVLLTDDYFNDINPRSMRRLMNVVYIAGRLLKAFHIEFNWYHLALWVNITEQWPYRASWLIHHYEKNEDSVEEKSNLKELYDRVKNRVPNCKENEPLLEMDKDEKKFETFLTMHEGVLHVYNLVIFLPFTINLDPFIKKKIKEEELQLEESCPNANRMNLPWHLASHDYQSRSSTISNRGKGPPFSAQKPFAATLPPSMNPLMWGGYGGPYFQPQMPTGGIGFNPQPQRIPTHIPTDALPSEAQDKKLSSLSINEIFDLFKRVDGVSPDMLPSYQEKFASNNINGKVLLHCSLDDLKQILSMTFGDWELFKMLILGLRELEFNHDEDLPNLVFDPVNGPQNLYHNPASLSDHSEVDSSTFKRGSIRGSKEKEETSNYHNRRPTKHNLHAKQADESCEHEESPTFLWREAQRLEIPQVDGDVQLAATATEATFDHPT